MDATQFDRPDNPSAWCPGCGNFAILKILKETIAELEIQPQNLVVVSGIGQAAKIPQYFKTNYFNGLHGRTLPPATAIKVANPSLTVLAESGDGDMYGEGGNHFIHTIRRNPDITQIVHNNMVYGLTKGQASPTSQTGFMTPIQKQGVFSEPFNPLAVAVALNASFVARAFAGDQQRTKEILKQAIKHKGYALVDIFQPCVTFNKVNTYKWFKEKSYYLDDTHEAQDRVMAFQRAIEADGFPLGILYLNRSKPTFEENVFANVPNPQPLFNQTVSIEKLQQFLESKRE